MKLYTWGTKDGPFRNAPMHDSQGPVEIHIIDFLTNPPDAFVVWEVTPRDEDGPTISMNGHFNTDDQFWNKMRWRIVKRLSQEEVTIARVEKKLGEGHAFIEQHFNEDGVLVMETQVLKSRSITADQVAHGPSYMAPFNSNSPTRKLIKRVGYK